MIKGSKEEKQANLFQKPLFYLIYLLSISERSLNPVVLNCHTVKIRTIKQMASAIYLMM